MHQEFENQVILTFLQTKETLENTGMTPAYVGVF